MHYINKTTGRSYYGGPLVAAYDGKLFCGIPTKEKLLELGYEEYVPEPKIPTELDLKHQRMDEILSELRSTDYLSLKDYEGEDMSEHPGWKEHRAALRVEYRQLEAEVEALENPQTEEPEETPEEPSEEPAEDTNTQEENPETPNDENETQEETPEETPAEEPSEELTEDTDTQEETPETPNDENENQENTSNEDPAETED